MCKSEIILAGLAALLFTSAPALAHPGPKIMMIGGKKTERVAMTPGMSYENTLGVHLFRGAPNTSATAEPAANNLAGGAPVATTVKIVVKKRAAKRPYRRIRHLRTQGFYSGKGPASRRFTQGFFADRN